ncbi:MAG: DeoR family transcriptional regulator [Parcubacteria group bacterium]|nr:DeoR family transcriptional regulator [Parcubacteria group bacterium]
MFLDEGHKKDTSIGANGSEKSLSRFEMETTDQHALFVSQKTEKITTALYLITDFIKDKEPYKWEMRHSAMKFLSFINSFKGIKIALHKEEAVGVALPLLSEILSLLRFGVSVKFISQMNYAILRDEYTSLYETLEDRLKMRQSVDGIMLPQDFFELKTNLSSREKRLPTYLQGQNKNNTGEVKKTENSVIQNGQEKIPAETTERSNQNIVDPFDKLRVNPEQGRRIESKPGLMIGKKGMRQDVIFKLLKSRGEVSIKDISEVVSGCSEKTIQRELLSLVEQGIVRKTGERRWSKYALSIN